jgi:uncharacterized membrane protein YcjF (UPF0283 family)
MRDQKFKTGFSFAEIIIKVIGILVGLAIIFFGMNMIYNRFIDVMVTPHLKIISPATQIQAKETEQTSGLIPVVQSTSTNTQGIKRSSS